MNIGSSYENALLSEASYADFQNIDITDPSKIKTALKNIDGQDKGFSQTQAEDFVKHWRVSVHQPNTASGFSATLFENIQTGEKVFAIRGSEKGSIADWYTDFVDIGILGSTNSQGQYQDLKNFYQQLISDGTLGANETFNVTGHSLGGFLAQSFAIDYPFQIGSTYTYNAPGIGGGVLDALGVAQGNITVAYITNVIAESGPELAAGLGTLIGSVNNIFIEDQGILGILDNHSIKLLTDSLAVYNLLSTLDPTLSTTSLTPLLEIAAYRPERSLENMLDSLGELFGISGSITVDDRESLYKGIDRFMKNSTFQTVAGFTHIVPVSSLHSAATADTVDGFAYRYALLHLNPFAVTGNAGLYSPSALSAGKFSEDYLQDRAYMLDQLLSRNSRDTKMVPTENGALEYYDDRASNTVAATFGTTFGIPAEAIRYTFGGAGTDTIDGGNRGDRLYVESRTDVSDQRTMERLVA